jgi:hypothetical protein
LANPNGRAVKLTAVKDKNGTLPVEDEYPIIMVNQKSV